jgi:hypothetical protein
MTEQISKGKIKILSLSEQRFYLYVDIDSVKNYLIRYDYDVVPVLTTNKNDATIFITGLGDQLIGLNRDENNNIITSNPLCNTSKFKKEFTDLIGGKRKKRTRRRRKKGTTKRRRN